MELLPSERINQHITGLSEFGPNDRVDWGSMIGKLNANKFGGQSRKKRLRESEWSNRGCRGLSPSFLSNNQLHSGWGVSENKLTASPLFSLWFLLVQLYAATLWACQEATFPTRTSQPLVSGQSPPLPDMEGENGHRLEKPEFWVGQMAPLGLPRWPSDKEPACQCRQCSFDPCIRKIPWSRKWCPTPVFLHREFYGPLGSLQSMGLQRVRHFWGTEHAMHGLDRITGSRG